jgi:hypothetical protein
MTLNWRKDKRFSGDDARSGRRGSAVLQEQVLPRRDANPALEVPRQVALVVEAGGGSCGGD